MKGAPADCPRIRPIRAGWWSGPSSTHTPGCLSVAPSGPTGGAVWMKLTWPVTCTTIRCPWLRYSLVRVHVAVPGTWTTVGGDNAGAEADARDLAEGVLSQVETLLADRGTDLPARLRDALAEQSAERATVTTLDTPLARAWRAHPAGGRRR
jgi:hypothetical protein